MTIPEKGHDTMYEQTEAFPKTELDEATAVLSHLISEQEKADAAVENAERKASDAATRVWKQQHVIAMLQGMMPAAEPSMEGEATEEEVEDAEVIDDESRQIEGDVVDPITGEVTGKEERTEGSVGVWWPNTDKPEQTKVGEHTQYAELVADYTHSGDPDMASDQIEEYSVVGIGDGRTRELNAAIVPEDHGLEFAVIYGDAGDLEAELRGCCNCGKAGAGCAIELEHDRDSCGCGGHGWAPVAAEVDPITGDPTEDVAA